MIVLNEWHTITEESPQGNVVKNEKSLLCCYDKANAPLSYKDHD